MEDNQSIAYLSLELLPGKKLESKIVSIEEKPRYYMIGNVVKNKSLKNGYTSIDAIKVMSEMSTRELWILNKIKDNLMLKEDRLKTGIKLRTSCIAFVEASKLTNAEKQKFKAGFKLLKEKNIVKRIRREKYIINPDFLIPYFYSEEKQLWDSLP